MEGYKKYLKEQERTESTVEKYLRDVKGFTEYCGEESITKEVVIAYKSKLGREYKISSANSMLAAINSYLVYKGREELCVKQFRVQRRSFGPEMTAQEHRPP